MKKKRPIIGITKPESKRMNLSFLVLLFSLWFTGGKVRITSYEDDVKDQRFDALMLGGGTDIFPGLFFKDPKENYTYDRKRDSLEVALLQKAIKEKIPVFAICRGAQLMNVVCGGTLQFDLRDIYGAENYPNNYLDYLLFRKKIVVKENSMLSRITGRKELMVNSIHNHSIDKVGKGLIVSSREPNGVVQSIEMPRHPFFIGVQFHPERLLFQSPFHKLFVKFISEAKKKTVTS